MEPHFLSERELGELNATRPIAIFGAGYYGEKTLNLLTRRPLCLLDNSDALQGTRRFDLDIRAPESVVALRERHPDLFVIVCVQAYRELDDQLRALGLVYGESCGITPVERDLFLIERLERHRGRIVFSNYDLDGGVYRWDFGDEKPRKHLEGSFRGLQRLGDFVFACSARGLHKLAADTLIEVDRLDLESHNNCGITWDAAAGRLVVSRTLTDELLFVDPQAFRVAGRLALSPKFERFGRESHHLNDLVVVNGHVLASMFSVSGWWRYGVYDGGIVEIDTESGAVRELRSENFHMPHSLTLRGDRLWLLDSMTGRLVRDLRSVVAELPGYTRGLAFDGDLAYVGQSKHRHVSRSSGRKTVSIDSGIHLLDLEHGLSRFVPLPGICNIYQIVVDDPEG